MDQRSGVGFSSRPGGNIQSSCEDAFRHEAVPARSFVFSWQRPDASLTVPSLVSALERLLEDMGVDSQKRVCCSSGSRAGRKASLHGPQFRTPRGPAC